MFIALNEEGFRVPATLGEKGHVYTCQACGEEVRLYKENLNHKHFKKTHYKHLPHSTCNYGKDKDHMSEWHRRMQDYFPIQYQEVPFPDKQKKEKLIADIYIPETNIVLEFQHSPISREEFIRRTMFHLYENRRIVWLFDESEENPKSDHIGKFERTFSKIQPQTDDMIPYYYQFPNNPYNYLRWLRNRRDCISALPPLESIADKVAICVYTGMDGDCFHRIQHKTCTEKYTTIVFSLHSINMKENMDTEEFFVPEEYWQQEPPFCNLLLPFNRWKIQQQNQRTIEEIRQREIDELNNRIKEHPVNPLGKSKRNFHF